LLRRNWLKGSLGDALHAVLCGAGHNLRMILRKLRLLCAWLSWQACSRSCSSKRRKTPRKTRPDSLVWHCSGLTIYPTICRNCAACIFSVGGAAAIGK
ncbi:MAG: hypothetical protein LBP58_06585, partial [Azoarcus sp.]|nr:hypothetical protein [Azoarcus sp.]